MQKGEHAERGGPKGSPLSGLSGRLNRLCEALLFSLLCLMIGVTTLQVVCRFFFDALVWSEELTRFLLVLASLVGAAVGFKRGSHIAVTFFLHRLPPAAFRIMAVLLQLVAIAFFGIVAWYGGVLMVSESGQTTPALGISMTWVYLMYPVMGAVVTVHLLDGIWVILKGR